MNSLSTGIRQSLALSTIERRFDWSHCQKQAILSGDKATTVLQSFIHLFFFAGPLRILVRPGELQRYSAHTAYGL